MEQKIRYSPLENGFFKVYEGVQPTKGEKFSTLLGDTIQMPEGWTVNEAGIPITGGKQYEEQKKQEEELMINNPEVPTDNSKTLSNYSNNKIVNLLMSRLNLTKEQASGIAGVMMSESGLNPSSYNKSEKAGKLKSSSANGSGYGAGLLQWSGPRKNKALQLIGKSGSIENLSLEDQIEIVARELEGPYRNTLQGIKASTTASQAAATMYCHNVGGFSSSTDPATQSEIDKMNQRYSKFTGKDPNKLVVNRGMRYAEQIFKDLI